MAKFNQKDTDLIVFLKEEFLSKGSKPDSFNAPATLHTDVKQRFSLSDSAYREFIARLQTSGIVDPVGSLEGNGYLIIHPEIVDLARELAEPGERPQSQAAIHIQHMSNSAIVQNSPGATQILHFSQTKKNDVAAVVAAIRQALATMELDDSTKSDLTTQLDYTDGQLKKESPKPGILKSALEGIHEGLVDVAKSGASAATVAAATGLGKRVWELIQGAFS